MYEDILSMNGISFGSLVGEILDKPDFTLEELLQEDEILQEAKSANTTLLDFLCLESSLSKLIDFLVVPASKDDLDLRRFKYPYISCEILCLEVSCIIKALFNISDGRLISRLLSLLDSSPPLDNYLAGYFEKVLEMLLRKETIKMIRIINEGGFNLFNKFIGHTENYSIMQLVQRLLLPHIPFSTLHDTFDSPTVSSDEKCCWSLQEDYTRLLLTRMLESTNSDGSAHISDLLITVIQLSPPESSIIVFLGSTSNLATLLRASFPVSDVPEAVGLAASSVLESLASRLSESSISMDKLNFDSNSTESENVSNLVYATCAANVGMSMRNHVVNLSQILKKYLDNHSILSTIVFQAKVPFPTIGSRGIQLVKLLESLVRLRNDMIDQEIMASGILSVGLDLMFYFRCNSILHLSVQRIIQSILETCDSRRALAKHTIFEANLLQRVMEYLRQHANPEVTSTKIAGLGSPVLGHVVFIAQTIHSLVSISECEPATHLEASHAVLASQNDVFDPVVPVAVAESIRSGEVENSLSESALRGLFIERDVMTEWQEFYNDVLANFLQRQIVNPLIDHKKFLLNSGMLDQWETNQISSSFNLRDFDDHPTWNDPFKQQDEYDEPSHTYSDPGLNSWPFGHDDFLGELTNSSFAPPTQTSAIHGAFEDIFSSLSPFDDFTSSTDIDFFIGGETKSSSNDSQSPSSA